jgi:hypothetical protein
MNKLNEHLIIKIMDFTLNEDVFNIVKLNKFYNNMINNNFFFNKILHRYHPATFNLFDNYCLVCNLRPLFLTDFNINFSRCSHH